MNFVKGLIVSIVGPLGQKVSFLATGLCLLWQGMTVPDNTHINGPVPHGNPLTEARGKWAWLLTHAVDTHKYVANNKNKGFLQMTPLATLSAPLKTEQTRMGCRQVFRLDLSVTRDLYRGRTAASLGSVSHKEPGRSRSNLPLPQNSVSELP